MGELSRKQVIGYLIAGLVIVALGALWARGGGSERVHDGAGARERLPAGGAASGDSAGGAGSSAAGSDGGDGPATVEVDGRPADGGTVLVHVAGAVRRPGIYRLSANDRVATAIERAGGARRHADLDAINLAAKLSDGRQVLVPPRASPPAGSSAAAGPARLGAAPAGGPDAGATAAGTSSPVNLNSATAEELDRLDGVGPVVAQKIVEYRQQHGGFGSVDELDAIPGIGPKRLEVLRAAVTV